MPRGRSFRPAAALAGVVALVALGGGAAASAAPAAKPTPITVPGGLTAKQAARVAADTGTCDGSGVCIVKDQSSDPSCTGYSSQTVPPKTIRVLLAKSNPLRIVTVPFQQYVDNVLPNEWVATWDGEAIKTGAVAVKSYAWYWVTHYGGYINTESPTTCFDVTDNTDFQKYVAGSSLARTNKVVQQTWDTVLWQGRGVFEASYQAGSADEKCGANANGTELYQNGSQACAHDGETYRQILSEYYSGITFESTVAPPGQLATPDAFDYLGLSRPAVYTAGTWSLYGNYGAPYSYGGSSDIPVVTNEGDGYPRIGIFRPSTGTWYQTDLTGTTAVKTVYGQSGDIPVAAHYNGIGKASVLGIFRPSDGSWHRPGFTAVSYGKKGDIPVPGNYDGDALGTTDIAIFRPSNGTWYFDGAAPTVQYGQQGDIPVPGDYDGDGKTEVAVFRPSNGTWYIRGQASVQYGGKGDIPVTGDFNGDGKTDIALYRPSNHTWYIRGQASRSFGYSTSIPIGKAPLAD